MTHLGLLPLERYTVGKVMYCLKHTNCPEDIKRHLSPVACVTDMWGQAGLSSDLGNYVFPSRLPGENL